MEYILKALATFVLFLIIAGILQRKNRKVHYSLMIAAFVIDVAIVLYIELTRQAVETVVSGMGPLLMFHVIVSVMALLLYVVQFVLGFRILKGKAVSTSMHLWCGVLFCVCRLTNYITSFMV